MTWERHFPRGSSLVKDRTSTDLKDAPPPGSPSAGLKPRRPDSRAVRLVSLSVALALATVLAGCPSGPLTDRISHVGSANHDLISAKAYPKLYVEIDSPPGYGPNADALSAFKDTLAQVSGRSTSDITIDTSDTSIPAEPDHKYTEQEIQDLESKHRSHHTGGDTAALYVVYVAGGNVADSGQSSVLGEAYRGTSIAMFKGNVKATSSSGAISTKPSELCVERAVVIHEFGHAAGLVNLGTPMQTPHEDSSHPGHSSDQNSVMYWAVDGSASLLNLLTPLGGGCEQQVPWHFDADDQADLRALAAK